MLISTYSMLISLTSNSRQTNQILINFNINIIMLIFLAFIIPKNIITTCDTDINIFHVDIISLQIPIDWLYSILCFFKVPFFSKMIGSTYTHTHIFSRFHRILLRKISPEKSYFFGVLMLLKLPRSRIWLEKYLLS